MSHSRLNMKGLVLTIDNRRTRMMNTNTKGRQIISFRWAEFRDALT